MKLNIVYSDIDLGGIQVKILDLIQYLSLHYPDVNITLLLREKKGIYLPQIPKNVKVLSPNYKRSFLSSSLFPIWLITRFVKETPDTILAFSNYPAICTILAKKVIFWKKIKLLISEDILVSKSLKDLDIKHLRNFLIRLLYPLVDRIFVMTSIHKNDLHNQFNIPLNKISITQNWLPFTFSSSKKNTSNQERSIDILSLGRLELQKNYFKFIDIIKKLKLKYPKIKVKIVGDGSQKYQLKAYIRQNHLDTNISIIKPTTNPIHYYLRSKIYLITSNYEGFPLTLLEAINSGCIPVVYNISEIAPFFDYQPNNYLFINNNQAVKIITKNLTFFNQQESQLTYYKNKVISHQIDNINYLVKFIT